MGDLLGVLRDRVEGDDTVIFFGGDDLFALADSFAAELQAKA
jgi:hypothetical protein